MHEIIDRTIDTWNNTDPRQPRALVDAMLAEQASYIDPLAQAHGRDGIDALIAVARAQFPGFQVGLTGPVDTHHQAAADPASTGLSRSSSASTSRSPTRPASSSASSASSRRPRREPARKSRGVLVHATVTPPILLRGHR